MSELVEDVVGIGIGPFNLGLAALGASVPGLRVRCFDRAPGFDWHPGMMISGTTLQVSFLADLVTAAEPTSPFSVLSYLKRTGRLYSFAIRERPHLTRTQFNAYCQWVAAQLPTLEFGVEIQRLDWNERRRCFVIEGRRSDGVARRVLSRNVVIGVGTVPSVPSWMPRPLPTRVVHSSSYLAQRRALLNADRVILVGSGQSAAEIFCDLAQQKSDALALSWFTRSERFYPMDDSKLALEMASPDYIDHFHALPLSTRSTVLSRQDGLYRGISRETLEQIYALLHDRTHDGPRRDLSLAANIELETLHATKQRVTACFHHRELERRFQRQADYVILATGYQYRVPELLKPLRKQLEYDARDVPILRRDYSIAGEVPGLFVNNGVPDSHGFTTADLSLGPYRNSIILNSILGQEHFFVEKQTAFQSFGVPEDASAHAGVAPRRAHLAAAALGDNT